MPTEAALLPEHSSPRSIYEGARDLAREIAKTEAYQTSRYQRKKVEMLFAHLKRILKLDRLRLRGSYGARHEFHLAAISQNLRKLAKPIPGPQPIAAARDRKTDHALSHFRPGAATVPHPPPSFSTLGNRRRLFPTADRIGSANWERRPKMEYFAGLDVSMEETHVCVVTDKARSCTR